MGFVFRTFFEKRDVFDLIGDRDGVLDGYRGGDRAGDGDGSLL